MPLDGSVKTPIILTVSPYLNHSGGTSFNPQSTETGPVSRFYDFLDMSGALTKGYSYVMVDLPGFGGSAGCNDWGGTREQLGVRAAVEWAASRPWSNGKVALLGKSYDGWTGLMGIAQQPQGLAAVIALEPVYSGYRYIWMNGVRRTNWPYGSNFTNYDANPGRLNDEPMYNVNGAPQAWCYPVNLAGQNADSSEGGPYWAERNLIPTAVGKTTPIFLTQGFLETNTKWDGTAQYYNSLAGNENRAWFGQFDHTRCWEKNNSGSTPSGNNTRWQTGREGQVCMDQIMTFLDEHLKGIEAPQDPTPVEVQDIRGRWREEAEWPPQDSIHYTTELNTGTYTDNGTGSGQSPTDSQGIWTVSEPLPHDVWLSGEPVITAGVDASPNANFAANVYEITPDGDAQMISKGVSAIPGTTGTRTVSFTMYGQDWPIAAGNRIGVLISDAERNEFQYPVAQGTVTVRSAKISLPFLTYDRTEFIPSEETTPRLENFLATGGSVSEAKVTSAQKAFNLPGPLQANAATA
jgi:predicted acyl esterase